MRNYQQCGGTKRKNRRIRAAKKSSAVNNLTINLYICDIVFKTLLIRNKTWTKPMYGSCLLYTSSLIFRCEMLSASISTANFLSDSSMSGGFIFRKIGNFFGIRVPVRCRFIFFRGRFPAAGSALPASAVPFLQYNVRQRVCGGHRGAAAGIVSREIRA